MWDGLFTSPDGGRTDAVVDDAEDGAADAMEETQTVPSSRPSADAMDETQTVPSSRPSSRSRLSFSLDTPIGSKERTRSGTEEDGPDPDDLWARKTSATEFMPYVPDSQTIFLHSTVLFVGSINLGEQLFFLRFDLYVVWHADEAGETCAGFDPDVRFPSAMTWQETSRMQLRPDDEIIHDGMAGYRATIEGTFRAHLDLSSFPFDAQALQVDMNMGVNRATSKRLSCADGWRFDHHPSAANMMLQQVNSEYHIRPLRYYITRTSALEDPRPCSKYILVIPMHRRTRYYLVSLMPTMFLTVLVSFVQFELDHDDREARLMVPLTLLFVLIGYKFTLQDSLPTLSYMTQLDIYVQFALVHLYALIAFEGLSFAAARRGICKVRTAHHFFWWVAVIYVALFHVFYALNIHRHMKKTRTTLKSMGSIDDTLADHLQANGIRFNKDGVVIDAAKYAAKLASEHSADKGDPDAASLMSARTRHLLTRASKTPRAAGATDASRLSAAATTIRRKFVSTLSSSSSTPSMPTTGPVGRPPPSPPA